MNRLHFWLVAKSNYNLHSPFLYRLYEEVLFAQIEGPICGQLDCKGDRVYHEMVYKFANHFDMHSVQADACRTLLQGDGRLRRVLVVNRPHRDAASERELESLMADADYQVALDMFDVAVFLCHPGMARQQYRLK